MSRMVASRRELEEHVFKYKMQSAKLMQGMNPSVCLHDSSIKTWA